MFELKKVGRHWLIRPTGGQFGQLDIPIGAKHVEIMDNFLVIDEHVYEIKASGNIAYVEKLPVISLAEEKHKSRSESKDVSDIQSVLTTPKVTSSVGLRSRPVGKQFDDEKNTGKQMLPSSKTLTRSEIVETKYNPTVNQTLKNRDTQQTLINKGNLTSSVPKTQHAQACASNFTLSQNLTRPEENISLRSESKINADENVSTMLEDGQTEYDSLEANYSEENSKMGNNQETKKDHDDDRGNKIAGSEAPFHLPLNAEVREKQPPNLTAESETDLSKKITSNVFDPVLCDEDITDMSKDKGTESNKKFTTNVRIQKRNNARIAKVEFQLTVTQYMKYMFAFNNPRTLKRISEKYREKHNSELHIDENEITIVSFDEREQSSTTELMKRPVQLILSEMRNIEVIFVPSENINCIQLILNAKQSELVRLGEMFVYLDEEEKRIYFSFDESRREQVLPLTKPLEETVQLTVQYVFLYLLNTDDIKTTVYEKFPDVALTTKQTDQNHGVVTLCGNYHRVEECRIWCEKNLFEKYSIASWSCRTYFREPSNLKELSKIIPQFLEFYLKDFVDIKYVFDTQWHIVWIYSELGQGYVDSVFSRLIQFFRHGVVKGEIALIQDMFKMTHQQFT